MILAARACPQFWDYCIYFHITHQQCTYVYLILNYCTSFQIVMYWLTELIKPALKLIKVRDELWLCNELGLVHFYEYGPCSSKLCLYVSKLAIHRMCLWLRVWNFNPCVQFCVFSCSWSLDGGIMFLSVLRREVKQNRRSGEQNENSNIVKLPISPPEYQSFIDDDPYVYMKLIVRPPYLPDEWWILI